MIVLFTPEHLYNMELRPSEAARLDADPQARQKIIALADIGYGATIFYQDKIIGIIGFIELWPGVIEVWAFPSVYVEKFPVVYLRKAKRYIQMIEKSHKPQRIQTATVADEMHDNWMLFLGFHCETPDGMKKHSALGETFNMWAKVSEYA